MAKRRREMESKDEHLQGASQAEWLLMKAKVALAVAILKNKPSGSSSRQFTEVLASKLKSHDEGWKERAQELQQEVLRLRQEVLITRVTSSTRSRTEEAAHDDPVDNASQDLFDSETPELLSRDPQPAVSAPQPPVPCSLPHVRFLQLLCGLHRGLEPLWFHPKGDGGSVVVDSVCQLLDSVVAACRDPPLLGPRDLILQGCQVAARAMELFCSQRPPSVEFMTRVEESLRELTGTLLNRNQLSTLPAAEELTEYLFTLGSSSMSKSFLIGHVLSQISTLADQLWQAFQAFGNHEFDNGVEGLMKPFLEQVKFPVLSCNIKPDQTVPPAFGSSYLPYKIVTVGGERVGVVGFTSQETPALTQLGTQLKFEDEVEALQLQVNKLQTLGVNKIIALGHSGLPVDQEIAQKVRGVDVVIGGHSNTFLFTGSPPSSEVPAGPYPLMVKADDGRQVPVVQAYAFGKYLGYLKVTFDDAGNVVRSTGNPILLDSSIPQDPEVLADVDEWKKSLANYSAQVVGRTLVFLNGTTEECRFRECNLGNLICDAMVSNNIRFPDDTQWNQISASILNGGGIRTSVDERSGNGSITMEDVMSVLPFGGTVNLMQLNGSTLRKVFEHSAKRHGQGKGEFLQVSGFHVEFDVSKPPGSRVRSLLILCTKCRVPHYEPVENETVYTVVVPSFLATGGDGYSMIKDEALKHNSGDLDISVVSNYIMQSLSIC